MVDPVAPGQERVAQLARVPFFEGLTPEALALIAQVTTLEAHALGTRIFQFGDPGDKLFIIVEGKVRISREVSGLGEEALAVAGLLRPGGLLLYATCSILPVENQDRVAAFTARTPGLAPVNLGENRTIPGLAQDFRATPATTGTDGFYAAGLRRA